MQRQMTLRRATLLLAAILSVVVLLAWAPVSSGDLSSREQSLQQSITSESGRIATYRGRLQDLRVRLARLESSLATEQAFLTRIHYALASEHSRLTQLRAELRRDRRVLVVQ